MQLLWTKTQTCHMSLTNFITSSKVVSHLTTSRNQTLNIVVTFKMYTGYLYLMYGYSTHKYIIPKGTPGYRHRTKFLGCRVHKTKKTKTKTQQNTICFGHNFMQTNTNNVNKT